MREVLRTLSQIVAGVVREVVRVTSNGLLVLLVALARSVPVAVALWALVLAALAIAALYCHWPSVAERLLSGSMMKTLALVLGAGLLGTILQTGYRYVLHELGNLRDIVVDLLFQPWPKEREPQKNLDLIRSEINQLYPAVLGQALACCWRLPFAVVLFAVVIAAFYPVVENQVGNRNATQSGNRFVVVVAADAVVGDEATEHLQAGATFALMHLEDGQPKSGEGICLNQSHIAFLSVLREAIVECIRKEREHNRGEDEQGSRRNMAPIFDVAGFASIAPARSGNLAGQDASNQVNCEIANRRAHAVAAFLAHGKEAVASTWKCPDVGEDFAADQCICKPCTDDVEKYTVSDDKGVAFEVRVRGWQDAPEMLRGKPANDGSAPEDRRFAVEALNRSVHISTPLGFCALPDAGDGAAG